MLNSILYVNAIAISKIFLCHIRSSQFWKLDMRHKQTEIFLIKMSNLQVGYENSIQYVKGKIAAFHNLEVEILFRSI